MYQVNISSIFFRVMAYLSIYGDIYTVYTYISIVYIWYKYCIYEAEINPVGGHNVTGLEMALN